MDGWIEGASDTVSVGEVDGLNDGASDTVSVGVAEGMYDGAALKVGSPLGTRVGLTESLGATDGWNDGASVLGCSLGIGVLGAVGFG